MDRCASEGCNNPPTYIFEAGGVSSTYCASCKSKIDLKIEFDRKEDNYYEFGGHTRGERRLWRELRGIK